MRVDRVNKVCTRIIGKSVGRETNRRGEAVTYMTFTACEDKSWVVVGCLCWDQKRSKGGSGEGIGSQWVQ